MEPDEYMKPFLWAAVITSLAMVGVIAVAEAAASLIVWYILFLQG